MKQEYKLGNVLEYAIVNIRVQSFNRESRNFFTTANCEELLFTLYTTVYSVLQGIILE